MFESMTYEELLGVPGVCSHPAVLRARFVRLLEIGAEATSRPNYFAFKADAKAACKPGQRVVERHGLAGAWVE